MFGKNKHRRCTYAENAPAPFTVRQVPARDLREGMTLVMMPEGWQGVTSCCDHWPLIIDKPRYREHGEGGEPCVYWTTDEPGDDAGDRSPHYWAIADLPITVAAGRTVR
jgi:predicted lipoprotein with Yx(FWY)xxD motif